MSQGHKRAGRLRGEARFAVERQVSAMAAVVTLPEAAWEASLGIWLVVKGFRPAPVSCDPVPVPVAYPG
jgi:hypothetical protein